MNNDKIVAHVFLILALAAMYSQAQVNDENSQDIRFENKERNFLPRWPEQYVSKRSCRADGSFCFRDSHCCGISNCFRYNFGPFGIFGRYRCGRYGDGGDYAPGDLNRSRHGPSRCGGDGHRCGRK
jgi:hypothetical protein